MVAFGPTTCSATHKWWEYKTMRYGQGKLFPVSQCVFKNVKVVLKKKLCILSQSAMVLYMQVVKISDHELLIIYIIYNYFNSGEQFRSFRILPMMRYLFQPCSTLNMVNFHISVKLSLINAFLENKLIFRWLPFFHQTMKPRYRM